MLFLWRITGYYAKDWGLVILINIYTRIFHFSIFFRSNGKFNNKSVTCQLDHTHAFGKQSATKFHRAKHRWKLSKSSGFKDENFHLPRLPVSRIRDSAYNSCLVGVCNQVLQEKEEVETNFFKWVGCFLSTFLAGLLSDHEPGIIFKGKRKQLKLLFPPTIPGK